MTVVVKDDFGEWLTFGNAVGFRTEVEYNNLEVSDEDGCLIAAYAGGKWVAAKIVEDQ